MVTDPHTPLRALTQDALRSAVVELLQAYGRTGVTLLASDEVCANERELAVTVSFGGPFLRGTLALAVTRPLLCALSPLRDASDTLEHGDWIRELGNQLLGRVKNKLVPYGIALSSGAAAVLEGRELTPWAGENLIEERLRCGEGVVRVWLDAHARDDAPLTRSDERAANEGSVLLF
jgi:hypothetical protein